jgi:hypothetical protein
MGGVLLPGRDLPAANPAWYGVPLDLTSNSLPIPLGLYSGLTADTEGQDEFERAITRIRAAYPFFEVELDPEPDISDDIEIGVGKDYLQIDLGQGTLAIPEGGVNTDYLSTMGLVSVHPGPLFLGLSTMLVSTGVIDVDDRLRSALKESVPFEAATTYKAGGDVLGQFMLALEVGTSFRVAGVDTVGWNVYAGGGVKGMMGLGFLSTHLDADLVTGDPIFDENDPLDVSYQADLRFSRKPGWGVGVNLGMAAVKGPWIAGLSVENLGGTMWWTTEHRLEGFTPEDGVISTILAASEKVTVKLPVVWVANGGWITERWMVVGDLTLQQGNVGAHGGVERWFGPIAARTGLSWSEVGGVQAGVGTGIRFLRGWSFDVSIRTHDYLYSDGRGLFLGASFGVPL